MKAKDLDKKFDEGQEDIVGDLDLSSRAASIRNRSASTSTFPPGWWSRWTARRRASA